MDGETLRGMAMVSVQEARKLETVKNRGSYAATSRSDGPGFMAGYQRPNVACNSPFSTRVRTWSSRCAPRGVHRICCFLTIRLLIT